MTTVKDLALYLIDKEEHYPLSDEFIARYQQSRGGYITFAHRTGHLVDPQKHEPNQKWHFFESWLLRSFQNGTLCWNDNAEKTVYNRIQCPELLLWLLEAVGVKDLKVRSAKESAESGKEGKDHTSKIAKKIREKVTWEDIEDAMKL